MKQKLICTAVAAALSVAAGSALALAPGAFTPATIPQVFMSGATAQNGGIENVVRLLCADTTLDSYSNTKQVVYVCNAAAGTTLTTAGFTAGSPIAIHKESNGGSGNGITFVRDGTTLGFVDLTNIVAGQTLCVADAASSKAAAVVNGVTLAAKAAWDCSPATAGNNPITNQVPNIGFSDVDPPVLGQAVGTLQVNSPNQLIFGVPVTIALRNALQNAQAATGALPASCAASASDTVACTPSLSSSTIAGVYTGRLLTAAKIGVAGDATPLYLIRRGTTSGTQKTAEVVFLNADITPPAQTTNLFKAPTGTYNSVAASLGYVKEDPLAAIPVTGAPGACGDASTGFSVVTPTVSLVPPATTVFAGNANEEIVNCLNRHQSGGRYAIGINTTEFNQFANPSSGSTAIDSNFTTGFRFIKVDGYLPTVANVIRGNYQFFSEQVITNLPTIAGAALQVKSAIVAELGNAINVTTVNSTFTKWTDAPAGEQTSGLVKPAVSTACAGLYSATSTTPDTDPVNYTTKNPTGTKANNAIKPSLAVCTPRY